MSTQLDHISNFGFFSDALLDTEKMELVSTQGFFPFSITIEVGSDALSLKSYIYTNILLRGYMDENLELYSKIDPNIDLSSYIRG